MSYFTAQTLASERSRDAGRGIAVPVERWPLVGHLRGGDRGRDPPWIRVDEDVCSDLDRVDPFRRRTRGDAGHAVPVRLLLEPARVGDDHARLRDERGHVEV